MHTLHLHDLTSLCRAFKPTASSFFVCQMWTSAASDGRALRSASTQLEAIDVRAETASGSPETAIPVKASLLLLLLLLLNHILLHKLIFLDLLRSLPLAPPLSLLLWSCLLALLAAPLHVLLHISLLLLRLLLLCC